MFGLGKLQTLGILIAGAVIYTSVITGSAYLKGRSDGRALTAAAVERALTNARETTEKAINELADEADKARFRRRLCIDTGGVWSFADNECVKA